MIVTLQHKFLVLYHENASTSIYIMKNNRKRRKLLRKTDSHFRNIVMQNNEN